MPTTDGDGRNDEPEWGQAVYAAKTLLPAWLTERMMTDDWVFGLLLITGQVALVQRIQAVTRDANGTIWLDVLLKTQDQSEATMYPLKAGGKEVPSMLAPTDRPHASINASTVVMAVELMTS
jgi:hypothetical protein